MPSFLDDVLGSRPWRPESAVDWRHRAGPIGHGCFARFSAFLKLRRGHRRGGVTTVVGIASSVGSWTPLALLAGEDAEQARLLA
jgi:hypothetical protein